MVTVTRGAVHQRSDIEVEHHIVVNGVKLLRATNGRYFAESTSQPGRLWFLTGWSCQCPSFVHRQACRHHRALLKALDWTRPEPTPPTARPSITTACPDCNGSGSVPATISTGRSWRYGNETCCACHGTGAAVDTAA